LPDIATGYAHSGDVTIAYQTSGTGPDLVFVPGFVSHIELNWESPPYRRALERITRFARLITFDKRGIGLSDRSVGFGAIEERMDDLCAVMDATDAQKATLLGVSEGGPLSIMFAATYPDRVNKLALYGTYARSAWAPDYPIGREHEDFENFFKQIESKWGTGEVLSRFIQHAPDRETLLKLTSRWERLTTTPSIAAQIARANARLDVRAALSAVRSPGLVVHALRDPIASVKFGRYLAEQLLTCERYEEIDGDFHVSWLDEHQDLVMDPIEEFVTGHIVTKVSSSNRLLTTILFTDIVGSTERAFALGDSHWRRLLDSHDTAAEDEVARFRGRTVEHAGDGMLACFDGPARAVSCALRLVQRARTLGLEIRAGVHTGECEIRGEHFTGIAVHLAARVMAMAGPSEVLATRTVMDLVGGSGLRFEDRGTRSLKGFTQPVQVFAALQ
jgi:class 3 adenylate cyclase/pimeloyl-ACP methyl ester carboxylesterase